MRRTLIAIALVFGFGAGALVLGGGLYTDGEIVGTGYVTAIMTFADDLTLGSNGNDGQLEIYSEQGGTDYAVTLNPNATMTSDADFYLPADEPAAQSLLTVSTGGVMSWVDDSAGLYGALDDETGTGVAVFNDSPTFNDDIQLGANGADGALKIYSEQGTTDYTATLSANTAMTSAAAFYLPADEPAGTYLLTMTTGGVIGFDSSTYTTAQDLDDVCEGGATTDVASTFEANLTVGKASGTTGQVSFVGTTSGTAVLKAADAAGTGTSTLPTTTGTLVSTGDTGTVTAKMLQAAAADLGAADVAVNLGNTNGSYVTNVTTDGYVEADETRAEPVIGGGNGAWAAIRSITETVTIPVGSGLDPVVLTSGNLAPANSLLLGGTARVTDAPGGGATTLDIGVTGGNLDAIADGIAVAATTTANSVADGDESQWPILNATAAKLTLTTDADVTGDEMIVKVTVWYLVFSAQTE